MKIFKPVCIALCALSLFLITHAKATANALPTDISQKSKPATIKVLLTKLADQVNMEVKGSYLVYNPRNTLLIGSGILGNKGKVSYSDIGLKWGDLFPGNFELRIVPADAKSTLFVNGMPYKGCLEVYGIEGTINVVNEIDVENYLKSYLANEFSYDTHDEVLDAAVIVARTHLYHLISKNPGAAFHVEAKKIGYDGSIHPGSSKHIENAVNRTKHMILTYNKQPFAASWSKNSCGRTVSYSAIYRKGGQTPKGVSSLPSGFDREKHQWTFKLAKNELAHMFELDSVATIDLYQAANSDKIYAIRLGDGNQSRDVDFFELQRALGKGKLLSNEFTVQVENDVVTFSGFGEGAGIGLCLASAEILAKKNENAKKILAQLFPDTQLSYRRDLEGKSLANESTVDHIWR